MSLFTPSVQRLEITDARSTLLEQRGRRSRERLAECSHAPGSATLAEALDQLQPLMVSLRSSPLSIVVPDRWCKIFLTTPPSNAATVQDLRDAAAARLQLVYDVEPHQYYIQSDLSATAAFVCCAMERSVVDRLRELGRASRARVDSIRPQYFESLGGWKPAAANANQWLVSCDDTSVTIGMFAQGHSVAIVQTRWGDIDWSQSGQIVGAATREALRADVELPTSITIAGPPVTGLRRLREGDLDLIPLESNHRREIGSAMKQVPARTSEGAA